MTNKTITHYKSRDDVLSIDRFLIDLTIKCSNIRFETKLFNLNSVANVMSVRYYYITYILNFDFDPVPISVGVEGSIKIDTVL